MKANKIIYNVDRDARTKSLKGLIPDIFSHSTVLYVGARTERFDYGEEFMDSRYKITVLEVYKENVDYLKTIPWITEVIHGDVRWFTSDKKWDIVFWWHGPEHIHKKELPLTLKNLESMANKAVVLGCPWGKYDQHALEGNPYEVHVSAYGFEDFINLEYSVDCIGKKDIPRLSNLTAVKYIKE